MVSGAAGHKDGGGGGKSALSKEAMAIGDFVSTVVELKGECEPFQFTLDPPAIYMPGATYMHTTVRKAFRLINMSICPINFNWRQVLEPHVIQVEPSYGEIGLLFWRYFYDEWMHVIYYPFKSEWKKKRLNGSL